jgi:hypothetical protein
VDGYSHTGDKDVMYDLSSTARTRVVAPAVPSAWGIAVDPIDRFAFVTNAGGINGNLSTLTIAPSGMLTNSGIALPAGGSHFCNAANIGSVDRDESLCCLDQHRRTET